MSAEAYLKIVFNALCDYSECAIILALRHLRDDDESPFFPQIAKIKEEVKGYHNHYEEMASEYLITEYEPFEIENFPNKNA